MKRRTYSHQMSPGNGPEMHEPRLRIAGGYAGVALEVLACSKVRPDVRERQHLCSANVVSGYEIQTYDDAIGHVTAFMIDDKSWAIRHFVVETGHSFAGKEIVLSPTHVERMSYEESKVFVAVTRESLRETAEYQMPQPAYHDTKNFDD
jgi:hypothetical protein